MPDLNCRLAQCEERQKHYDTAQQLLIEKMDCIIDYQSKQKGFVAGMLFVSSSIVALIGYLVANFFHAK